MPLSRFEPRWGHQTFLVIASRIYPTENTSGFFSSNCLSIPSDAGGEDDRLKPLFLLELCAVPTACEIAERSLRKREHRADVQVFELGAVALHLRDRFLLAKPVYVLAKGLRVDGLLVHVRLDQSVLLLLDGFQPPRQPRLLVGGLILCLLPNV